MSTNLRKLLSDLSIEDPIGYEKVRLFPLRFNRVSQLQYLTLDDAASEKLVTIEETCAAGSVLKLRVRNRAKDRILIVDGSTLIGAKQNRVVNLSIMLAAESETEIPVSCVERGRWSHRTPEVALSYFADHGLRGKMCRGTTASLREAKEVRPDQGEVWEHVEGMLGGFGAASPTLAYHAMYEKLGQKLTDDETHLKVPENACGVAVEIDGSLRAVDLFDKPNTLQKLWPRLGRSYLVGALYPQSIRCKKIGVKEFLEQALGSRSESYEPVGVGTTLRLTNAECVGAALACDGELVHLSLFAKEEAEPGSSETVLPEPEESNPGQETTPNSPRRPWWRFWA
jgi:hypothetical protein